MQMTIPEDMFDEFTPVALMKVTLWTVFALILTIGACFAGDDRLGFCTHFDQQGGSPNWNPKYLMPKIAATKAAWIRDDWNWGVCEASPGVYSVPSSKQAWLDAAFANGLKVVAVLNYPPKFYPNPWSPATRAANFCAWLAQHEGLRIAAIEVINEPNNTFASQVGADWKHVLVTLTTAIYDAVHAVSPDTQVIGYGGQGSQVLDMLAMGGRVDGVVYHPYDKGDAIAESVYEPPYYDYLTWVNTVKAATKLPIWETEWAIDRGRSEYQSAIFDCRRLTTALWLGVKHTFIYDFCDSDTGQSVIDYYYHPRQNYFAIDRLFSVLTPDLVADQHAVGVTSSDPAFDSKNFMGFTFESGDPAYPKKSCAVVWFGHIISGEPIGQLRNPIRKAELTVYHPSASMVIERDLLSGQTSRPLWTQVGNNVVIHNAQISMSAVAYTIL
jgi:hypothetical protein